MLCASALSTRTAAEARTSAPSFVRFCLLPGSSIGWRSPIVGATVWAPLSRSAGPYRMIAVSVASWRATT